MSRGVDLMWTCLGECDEACERHDGRWYFSRVDVFMNFNVAFDESRAAAASERP